MAGDTPKSLRINPASPGRPLADLAADVGAHHERLDGAGYRFGLAHISRHR
jgi:HD-GYP domain-containing protein (c-di-GMP phosphodiesterase class II)